MIKKKKIIFGLVSIICIVTVISMLSKTAVIGDEPPEDDPTDPGNTSGPGFIRGPEPPSPGMNTEVIDIPMYSCIFTLTP